MNEHDKVINFIANNLKTQFGVLANYGTDKKWHIGGVFPDVILQSLEDGKTMFIIEVETSESLTSNVPQWKNYANLNGTFYIIVPQDRLNDAKKLAVAAGVKGKFGFYNYNNNEVTGVTYER